MNRILIVTPAPRRSQKGNRVTANRWARLLRQAGRRVEVATEYHGQPCSAMIAMHARKSGRSAVRFHNARQGPLIVVLTGTDLYHDLERSSLAMQSLAIADRVVVLQPHGLNFLPTSTREKTQVIFQSAASTNCPPLKRHFEVCVSGHLRAVKDPFLTAKAVRKLPSESRIRVTHIGAALTESMRSRAIGEMERNSRYRWLGEQPRWRARRYVARSRVLSLTSQMEGGANVVSEAIVSGTPVVGTRISGTIGLLGDDYPALFPVGDVEALRTLLLRCETDARFLRRLESVGRRLAKRHAPESERRDLVRLLAQAEHRA